MWRDMCVLKDAFMQATDEDFHTAVFMSAASVSAQD